MAAAMASGSLGGTTRAVSPSTAYSRQPPLSVVTSGVPQARASRPGWQNPSNHDPTTKTSAEAYSRPRAGWSRSIGAYSPRGTPNRAQASRMVSVPFQSLVTPEHRTRWRRGTSQGRNTSRLTPPSWTRGAAPPWTAAMRSAVQRELASWASTGANAASQEPSLP